jgi:hypothetical protein|tara:strand:+ start:162 stop:458 length:297 start_codon:yes stop_codon:yes gene_type:complete
MYHEDKKHYLLSGQQLNQILAMLQMISDRNPDIEKLNEFIRNLKDLRAYNDILDEFIFSDQKKMPEEIKPVGERDGMTLEEMLAGLELRLMDKKNGKD